MTADETTNTPAAAFGSRLGLADLAGGRLRAMTDHGYAIDLWLGELARQGKTEATRTKYWELGWEFMLYLEQRGIPPHLLQLDHCRGFLDTKLRRRPPRQGQRQPRDPVSASTLALYVSIIRSYITFLADEGIVEDDFSAKLKRPRRPRPEDIDVVTTSGSDVGRMIAACKTPRHGDACSWSELLCICTLAYLGPRRNAAGQARRQDVNLDDGLMRFREKGRKIIWKPIPDALLELYRAAEDAGVWLEPRDFLIPNRRPLADRHTRSSKVVYAIVKTVAARARVSSHPHALRAAFAVQFDEQHPELQHTLQDLMGHARPETTHIYLRRRNKAKAMEKVRDLNFGLRASPGMPPTGFEPVLRADPVPEPIRRKLDELKARDRRRARNC